MERENLQFPQNNSIPRQNADPEEGSSTSSPQSGRISSRTYGKNTNFKNRGNQAKNDKKNGLKYKGSVKGEDKHGYGTLSHYSSNQFLRGKWENDYLVELEIAQFKINATDNIRIYASDNLFCSNKNNFVARFEIQPFRIQCEHFVNIQQEIMSKISFVKILDDDLQNKLNKSHEEFQNILKAKSASVTELDVAKSDLFNLDRLININQIRNNPNDYITLLNKISSDSLFSEELRDGAKNICVFEDSIIKRERNFPCKIQRDTKYNLFDLIPEYISKSALKLKDVLLRAIPSSSFIQLVLEDINNLKEYTLFKSNVQDVKLFSDLEITVQQHFKTSYSDVNNLYDFIKNYINKLWTQFIETVNKYALHNSQMNYRYTNAVFLQLFKTFLELLSTIYEEHKEEHLKVVEMLPNSNIYFIENASVSCVVITNRLKFIISLMNHFKPGQFKIPSFQYNFSNFQIENILKRGYKNCVGVMFNRTVDGNISEEYLIWLYYIHNCFSFLINQEKLNRQEIYLFINSLMDLFKGIIQNCDIPFEKVRILANGIIKFGCTISPMFLKQTSVSETDLDVLFKLAEYLHDFIIKNEYNIIDVTNIIDIYQIFWEKRCLLFAQLNKNYAFWSTTQQLIEKFNKFINYIFNMKNYSSKFIKFLRSFNEYLCLLQATEFPWYIKEENTLSKRFVQLIENTNTNTYIVHNPEQFYKEHKREQSEPRHYLFFLTNYFLTCIENFLLTNNWCDEDKLEAASALLLCMARSLINFDKLSEAEDFTHFYETFTNPFMRITETSNDVTDFIKRLDSIENYYKYTMELNVMAVDKALEKCEELSNAFTSVLNCDFVSNTLKIAYDIYMNKFNKYVEKYISQTPFNIWLLVEKVKKKKKLKDIKDWTSQFKLVELPKILAGVSAVWSVLESKDLAKNQLIKPHCIQILCILRLLGVDKSDNGFENHLAQVLTGQGKSVILGLLASVLVLTGSRVRIVCYNKYLAERDRTNFHKFYCLFSLEQNIKYGTFKEMANEVISPNKGINLRTCVKELLLDELTDCNISEDDSLNSKTVLLIDEVDVFFSPEFYGNTLNSLTPFKSQTLAELQIKIWDLTSKYQNVSAIQKLINPCMKDMYLLSPDYVFKNLMLKSRSVLDCHIRDMISDAVEIRNSSENDHKYFKLNKDGDIVFIDNYGKHSLCTHIRYKNIFMYFKLKKNDFNHNYFHNYGYMNVDSGSVSYAILPNEYRSILGVTGTLRQLSSTEMHAISSYNITRGSIMPTFFGYTKLIEDNFTIKSTLREWMNAILSSIISKVNAERAVIVFFEDEHMIESVRNDFGKHLSRISVLTGNEDSQQIADYVDEAGVARTTTVTTRHMGRGVDFKSNDSHVETKGGVHVIQTFFSDDLKEETQIKGRTARKDNKGSYELILCRQHLMKNGYPGGATCYEQLNTIRIQKAEMMGQLIQNRITISKRQHEATLKFMKSLYKYNPAKRQEYLLKYPFAKRF